MSTAELVKPDFGKLPSGLRKGSFLCTQQEGPVSQFAETALFHKGLAFDTLKKKKKEAHLRHILEAPCLKRSLFIDFGGVIKLI